MLRPESLSTCLPEWSGVDPTSTKTERTTFAPHVFGNQASRWEPILGDSIDEMSSDPRTLNLLSDLIRFTEPKVIVEVGTYRGWGTATFAETLRTYNLPGHVWSCDPVDHGVSQMLVQAELSTRVTLVTGTFEDLLAKRQVLCKSCSVYFETPPLDPDVHRRTYNHSIGPVEPVVGKIDFCYIDASSKTEASLRLRYTRLALEYLAPGGLIAVDDAAGDWRGAKSLRKLASLYLPQHRGLALITT